MAAEDYPSRPIVLVNPNPPAGYTDNFGRLVSVPLGKELAGRSPWPMCRRSEMLGHEYFLRQNDDGYVLLVTAASFIPVNILLQRAPFKTSDFAMINLPARDYTLLATSTGSDLKSVDDVISTLQKNPASLSIGFPRSSTDYINLILLMQAAGIDTRKLRLITFESGGIVRTSSSAVWSTWVLPGAKVFCRSPTRSGRF